MYSHPITIGNLTIKSNIFIAPLAGYTNLPTRLIYRGQGAGIAYAEMVSALGLEYNYEKSVKLIKSKNEDRPLGIQLFGPDANTILNAFLKIKDKDFDIIDINCGCSVKKILRSNSGACLLKNPDEIYKIIYLLKQNTDRPVSLKIRSGWDNSFLNYLQVLDAAVKAGADLITFHPRTRSMMFKNKADWELIKDLKAKSPIPVIGNGDIFSGVDAVNMIKITGCDGVMLARGLIENPFLIEEVKASLTGDVYYSPSFKKRVDVLLFHSNLMVEYLGERKGVIEFRKFVHGYLKGLPNISKLRQRLNRVDDYTEFRRIINEYCRFIC